MKDILVDSETVRLVDCSYDRLIVLCKDYVLAVIQLKKFSAENILNLNELVNDMHC